MVDADWPVIKKMTDRPSHRPRALVENEGRGCRDPRSSSREWATKSFLGPLSFCNFNLASGHFPGLKAKVGLV